MIAPISPIHVPVTGPNPAPAAQGPAQSAFANLIGNGIENVNQKVLAADQTIRAFALDDSIPVHQVTYALAQAQASLELALQVRTRLLDGFQQLMNMQL